jgi:spermidine/putrescine transport system permease protein
VARSMSPLETMPVSPFARQTRWLLKGLAAIVLVFLYLPIGFLILFSFEEASTPGLPITGLTLHWYLKMLSDSAIQTAVFNSVIVAAAVAVLATIIGTMAAFPLVRGGIPMPGAARLLFTMPIMIPGVLLGIGLLIFFRRVADLNLSLLTVIAGHLVFTTPFVVLIVAARLQGFDRRLEWAAADLGADSRATLRHIVLPLISPAIIAGALLSVTLSIDEFVITFFTIGPQTTLPLYIYTQIKFGVTPEVNAVATIILVVTLAVFGLGSLVLSRGRHLLHPRRESAEVEP